MTDLPTPVARRLRPPAWRDPRLLVGVVLVLGSVLLGSVVVSRADHRVPMYAARVALVPGQPLEAGDLTRVDVHLGPEEARYLAAAAPPVTGRFVLRPVDAGELVPVSAVGGRDDVETQPLTLAVRSESASALVVGSRVDVYVNPVDDDAAGGEARFAGPELALAGVSVASLPQSEGGFGGPAGGERSVQVMAPTDRIRGLIGQVDEGARVTLVPVPGAPVEVGR